ncbi:MAG: choice-of-anchor tandem repeat GloVer-containing protein [Terriglobales bacterium]
MGINLIWRRKTERDDVVELAISAIRLLSVIVVLVFATSSVFGQTEQVLYSFQGGTDGNIPEGRVVFDTAGNLYGATNEGGVFQCGMVYQLSPPLIQGSPWTETEIYSFGCKTSGDAAFPAGGLVIDDAGNLYGSTAYGGAGNCLLLGALMGCGAVYELSPPTLQGGGWTETIIYSFPDDVVGGYVPWGDLVFDDKGNLYGATDFGGGHGTYCNPFYSYCGTVYELSPPAQPGGAWTEKMLHGFAGNAPKGAAIVGDGANPNGGLILDNAGNVYGTTLWGGNTLGMCKGVQGSSGCGTVFELSPPRAPNGEWTETILHRFSGPDGVSPAAGVIADGEGNLYGTTEGGPRNGGYGEIFKLNKPTGSNLPWIDTELYLFKGGSNGWYPDSGVAFDSMGRLYGTTLGSATNRGEVYRLGTASASGEITAIPLYNFAGVPDGAHPDGPLVFDQKGNIYGITQGGGTGTGCNYGGCGTVYELSP